MVNVAWRIIMFYYCSTFNTADKKASIVLFIKAFVFDIVAPPGIEPESKV